MDHSHVYNQIPVAYDESCRLHDPGSGKKKAKQAQEFLQSAVLTVISFQSDLLPLFLRKRVQPFLYWDAVRCILVECC